MDILKQAAAAYTGMLCKEYTVIVGKNSRLNSFTLKAAPDEFKHITGLHKLVRTQ